MDLLNFFTRFYTKLYNRGGLVDVLTAQLRKIVSYMANRLLPSYIAQIQYQPTVILSNVIVSLTSFPERINNVWMVIESLRYQSYQPGKIVLWLSRKQFPTDDTIPYSLKNIIDDVFEIKMVDDDLKSHKKYYYAFQKFPNKIVITVDDDVFYHPDVVKHLYEDYKKYPTDVISNIASCPIYDNGVIIPYKQWKKINKQYDCNNLVQIGIGGVLYPPGLLKPIVFDKELISELAPFADDLWLNSILRLAGVKVRKSSFRYLPLGVKSNAPTLSSYNRHNSGNDIQIENLRKYFKQTTGKDLFAKQR